MAGMEGMAGMAGAAGSATVGSTGVAVVPGGTTSCCWADAVNAVANSREVAETVSAREPNERRCMCNPPYKGRWMLRDVSAT
jgi:hypothetical protein